MGTDQRLPSQKQRLKSHCSVASGGTDTRLSRPAYTITNYISASWIGNLIILKEAVVGFLMIGPVEFQWYCSLHMLGPGLGSLVDGDDCHNERNTMMMMMMVVVVVVAILP